MSALSPAPMSEETWVAVLLVPARQLVEAGHETAADRMYDAVASFAEDH